MVTRKGWDRQLPLVRDRSLCVRVLATDDRLLVAREHLARGSRPDRQLTARHPGSLSSGARGDVLPGLGNGHRHAEDLRRDLLHGWALRPAADHQDALDGEALAGD